MIFPSIQTKFIHSFINSFFSPSFSPSFIHACMNSCNTYTSTLSKINHSFSFVFVSVLPSPCGMYLIQPPHLSSKSVPVWLWWGHFKMLKNWIVGRWDLRFLFTSLQFTSHLRIYSQMFNWERRYWWKTNTNWLAHSFWVGTEGLLVKALDEPYIKFRPEVHGLRIRLNLM